MSRRAGRRWRVRWERVIGAGAVLAAAAFAAQAAAERRARDEARAELAEARAELAEARAALVAARQAARAAGFMAAATRKGDDAAWAPYAAAHGITEAAVDELLRELRSRPPVRTEVLAVAGGADLFVLLAQDPDDPLAPGAELTVYRGVRFVARVRVVDATPEQARCEVLFTAEGEAPRPGDAAATRLE